MMLNDNITTAISNTIRYIGNKPSYTPQIGDTIYNFEENKYLVYTKENTWIDVANSIEQTYTKDELVKSNSIWVILYEKLCFDYPNKVNEFYTMLKLYEEDYEKTCVAIISSLGENDDKNGIW